VSTRVQSATGRGSRASARTASGCVVRSKCRQSPLTRGLSLPSHHPMPVTQSSSSAGYLPTPLMPRTSFPTSSTQPPTSLPMWHRLTKKLRGQITIVFLVGFKPTQVFEHEMPPILQLLLGTRSTLKPTHIRENTTRGLPYRKSCCI
jgi:hypothetical protein